MRCQRLPKEVGIGRFLTLDPLMALLSEPVSFNRYLFGVLSAGMCDRCSSWVCSVWSLSGLALRRRLEPRRAILPDAKQMRPPSSSPSPKNARPALGAVQQAFLGTMAENIPKPGDLTLCEGDPRQQAFAVTMNAVQSFSACALS